MSDFYIKIEGAADVEKTMNQLAQNIQKNVMEGMKTYISKHLVNRIKTRLENGTQGQSGSASINGLISPSGGYNLPRNDPTYADWKKTRGNLPIEGKIGTRELVATGNFLDRIKVTRLVNTIEFFEAEVGPEDAIRPKTFPFKNEKGNPANADTRHTISNIKLAEILEDGDYKFWEKEFSDVEKEVAPYLEYLIEITIKDLMLEYSKV